MTFFGAAGEVTGSCTLVESDRGRVLIDFGLFQGSPQQEERNTVPPALDFQRLDAVVCTHAHVDHCGRLGMLAELEFPGAVFCHEATAEMLPRVLKSSATLQAMRVVEYRNGSAPEAVVLEPTPDAAIASLQKRRSDPPVLYSVGQAAKVSRSIVGLQYLEWRDLAPGIRMRLHDAGHIIGSASVELEIQHGAHRIRVLFSGDLGSPEAGLLRARGASVPADVVIMESTTGARGKVPLPASGKDHAAMGLCPEVAKCTLEELVAEVRAGSSTAVMPTFSVGRAQLLVHSLAKLSRRGLVGGMPVYLDSPMASRTAEVCCGRPALLSDDARAMIAAGNSPLDFEELYLLWSRKQSLRIAGRTEAGLILAGSGFCDAGPVLHHLAHVLPNPHGIVVFSGHVLLGSLAHALAHGQARRVRINGKVLDVRARVRRIDGFSGHADAQQLEDWLLGSGHQPDLLVLNHGDGHARQALGASLQPDLTGTIAMPSFQETIALG